MEDLMMKKSFIGLVVALALVFGALCIPYKSWFETRLEAILTDKGFQNVSLTISSIGLKSATLSNISIGGDMPLVLKNIDFAYSPRELWNGNLREFTASGLDLKIKQDGKEWAIQGLQGYKSGTEEAVSPLAFLPLRPEDLAHIPFDRMTLKDSRLDVVSEIGQLSAPLDLTWQKIPAPEFSYSADGLEFTRAGLGMSTGRAALKANMIENKQWQGVWTVVDVTIRNESLPIPVLDGGGTLTADGEALKLDGLLKNSDGAWQVKFVMDYMPAAPQKSALTIVQAGMPWKQGRISVRNVSLPFEGRNATTVNLQVQHVSLDELMQWLTGNRVSGTGTVSGMLPVVIGRDGKLTILKGDLEADGPGTIVMPPETIPGDNEQVEFVREILKDLHFSVLSISSKKDENGRLIVVMAAEGNNPKVYDGRLVKLNVNLTGDILDFIEKNVMFLRSAETLLQQGVQ